ncbi:MAG: HAD-IA family hydrolase [Candidatus Latescibacteria bacterium]|nr:HAD-IA family hydrolase [Candidatus Latescibacterota bacterium]
MDRALKELFASPKLVVCDFGETLFTWNVDWDGWRRDMRRWCEQLGFEGVQTLRFLREHVEPEMFGKILCTWRDYEQDDVESALANRSLLGVLKLLKRSDPTKRLAIFSANLQSTIALMFERFDISDLFDLIVSTEDVLRGKPDPEGLIQILSAWDADPEDAILIGNSWKDLEAGRTAGVPAYDVNQMAEGRFKLVPIWER